MASLRVDSWAPVIRLRRTPCANVAPIAPSTASQCVAPHAPAVANFGVVPRGPTSSVEVGA